MSTLYRNLVVLKAKGHSLCHIKLIGKTNVNCNFVELGCYVRSRSDGSGLVTRPATGVKQKSRKQPSVHQQLQSKLGYDGNSVSLQSDINNDVVRRTKSPGLGHSDITATVSGVVTSELVENVINTEENYSEDLLPEAATEMGQGTYIHVKTRL